MILSYQKQESIIFIYKINVFISKCDNSKLNCKAELIKILIEKTKKLLELIRIYCSEFLALEFFSLKNFFQPGTFPLTTRELSHL